MSNVKAPVLCGHPLVLVVVQNLKFETSPLNIFFQFLFYFIVIFLYYEKS
jgi:hypothetical protein